MNQKLKILLVVFALVIGAIPAMADDGNGGLNPMTSAFRSTDYPLPRFVSLGSDEIYVRSGPGKRYPVQWVFKKEDLPVEIILEYDVWRKIKDFDGQVGWVHHSLLSGKRNALVKEEKVSTLYRKPDTSSQIMAYLEPMVLLSVEECEGGFCKVNASGYKGWVEQKTLWGVYETENFD